METQQRCRLKEPSSGASFIKSLGREDSWNKFACWRIQAPVAQRVPQWPFKQPPEVLNNLQWQNPQFATRTLEDLFVSTAGLHEQKKAQNNRKFHSVLAFLPNPLRQSRTLQLSPPGPGRLAWSSPEWDWAGWHRRGRQRGRRGCRGAEVSPPSTSQTSPSTRVHMAQRRAWARPCPRRRPPRSPATAARKAPPPGTWDTRAECWAPAPTGGPSCGTRARGRRPGRPKAACPPEKRGRGCAACWGTPGCWDLRGTGVARRWSPAWELLGASGWGCGRDLRQYATAKWLRTDPPGSRLAVYYSHSPPAEWCSGHIFSVNKSFCHPVCESINISPMSAVRDLKHEATDQLSWGLRWASLSQRVHVPTHGDLSPDTRLRLLREPALRMHHQDAVGC